MTLRGFILKYVTSSRHKILWELCRHKILQITQYPSHITHLAPSANFYVHYITTPLDCLVRCAIFIQQMVRFLLIDHTQHS